MLRIVMDGAGDMPPIWKDIYQIDIIPINIQFEERTFLQGIDLSNEDFYQFVDEHKVIPKTAQPSPEQFKDFYRKIARPGDTILSMHVTGSLSGTFSSAEIAARELNGEFDLYPLDSMSGSAALGYMCKEARLMDRAGASIEAILERMKFIRHNINVILTLDTLEYAHMSGRVKALQAALASVLNVKPIIVLREGVLDMADRVRTRSRALEYVLKSIHNRVGESLVNAAVVHARDLRSGEALMERVRATINCKELVLTELSIAVAANLGPGTVGIVAYPVEEGK